MTNFGSFMKVLGAQRLLSSSAFDKVDAVFPRVAEQKKRKTGKRSGGRMVRGSVCFHVLACPFKFSDLRAILCLGRVKPVRPCLFGPSLANETLTPKHVNIQC